MRIHSNILTASDIGAAAQAAGIMVVTNEQKGSRSRARAFEFSFSGSGAHRSQWRAMDHRAATWDEWGIALAHLFTIDPDAIVPRVYENAEHFHWATGDRYRTLTRDAAHAKHNWLSGETFGRSAGGAYHVQACACGAVLRRLTHGMSWDEFVYAIMSNLPLPKSVLSNA
jgi:hypothetical protein